MKDRLTAGELYALVNEELAGIDAENDASRQVAYNRAREIIRESGTRGDAVDGSPGTLEKIITRVEMQYRLEGAGKPGSMATPPATGENEGRDTSQRIDGRQKSLSRLFRGTGAIKPGDVPGPDPGPDDGPFSDMVYKDIPVIFPDTTVGRCMVSYRYDPACVLRAEIAATELVFATRAWGFRHALEHLTAYLRGWGISSPVAGMRPGIRWAGESRGDEWVFIPGLAEPFHALDEPDR